MKIKTANLTDAALDWAVCVCEGESPSRYTQYSTDWAQGGPIIEREKIGVVLSPGDANVWVGSVYEPDWKFNRTGPTPLTAAMRCYVASRLGDEVEVPDERL